MTDKIIVLSTCGSEDEAHKLAHSLVEQRLAACVNVVAGIRSFYRWEGKIEKSDEYLLVIKSSRDRMALLRAAIEREHSYEVPEVVALPIVDGSQNYLNWLQANLRSEDT
jgi:periplasmic divalent cation tolerance protein